MPTSLDSSRPIMAPSPRTSIRFSTYSMAPSLTPSVDSAHAEIREIASGLDRMENKALTSQRVHLDEVKTDNLHKLALGAKLERALDRRMSSQDAIMRPRKASIAEIMLSEKALERRMNSQDAITRTRRNPSIAEKMLSEKAE